MIKEGSIFSSIFIHVFCTILRLCHPMVNPLPFLSCVQICGHLVWSCVVGTPWLAQCAGVDIHKGRLITFCLRHKWKLLTTEENLPSDVPGQSAQFILQIIGLLVGWFWGMVSHFEERVVRAARFACLSLRAGQSSLCLHRKPALQSPEDMTWKFWISVKKHKFSPKHKINVYLWSPAHLPACAVSHPTPRIALFVPQSPKKIASY